MQLQAFGQAARTHADRVEILDLVQRRLDFIEFDRLFHIKDLLHVLEAQRKVTVLVDGVDQRLGDAPVGGRERRHLHLPQQVFAQRRRQAVAPVDVKVVVGSAVSAGMGGYRQFETFSPVAFGGAVLGVGRRFGGGLRLVGLDVDGLGIVGVLGRCGLGVVRAVGQLFFLEQWIAFKYLLDFLLQFDGGELQQADGLLQLGSDSKMLTQP